VKTGSLGDVMQESIKLLNGWLEVEHWSWVLGMKIFMKKRQSSFTVPEGATPKEWSKRLVLLCRVAYCFQWLY